MKKVGIVTLSGKHNYGNRLQNYALQTAINEFAQETVTITEARHFSPIKTLKEFVKPIFRYLPLYKNRFYYVMKKMKYQSFNSFDAQYIKEQSLSSVDIKGFDMFVSGSDQVWNPRFAGKDFHFLTFAPEKKRFSYAASFGVSQIPTDQTNAYSIRLKGFNKISVREEDAVGLVESLTGRRDVLVVPDPTMLISKDGWDTFIDGAAPKDLPTSKYIIVYALHDFTPVNQRRVEEYARDNKYEIYRIMGDVYDKSYKTPDPREFVYAISKAEAVFTDSFHCCVFSIINERPFIVFDRTDGQKMSSRLETLTTRFKLPQAMSNEDDDVSVVLKSEDFSETSQILSDYRKIGRDYLEEILGEE